MWCGYCLLFVVRSRERQGKTEKENNWKCTPGEKLHAMKALIYKSTNSFENRKPELRILLKHNELEKGFPRFTYHEHGGHENCDGWGGQTKPLAAGHTCEELFLIGSFEMGSPALNLATSFHTSLCMRAWKKEEFAFYLLALTLIGKFI